MMPTVQEIARQIVVMVELHPEMTTSQIASALAYPPIFIINAIAEAKAIGYLKEDKKNDKLTLITPVAYTQGAIFGETDKRISLEIVTALNRINHGEEDISVDQLKFWMLGIPESALEIAIKSLVECSVIAKYTLVDPKDPESSYTFITLKKNEGQRWGLKQFKDLHKKKK